ncbi:uncharacterized protein LOC106178479 [Lingula anatina]|uniref:Uncharacterized protein LOC106178479 n=1 Tax=Lingula anatina TaxID=7574 RepID=A0A1S3K3C1_LINAN|nr:uncharacterized protein LOC106178479 [Lingula anatina]XP_013417127.1 uncharacterized protein LOC106178479 [Lingula anatina]XP_013417128.1 uncharacterized protein LOC106178479 [Lingula anatina]|eukprot:XP_013417125.1 uncharacterized protein LOC106178479 [Lingula anatina]
MEYGNLTFQIPFKTTDNPLYNSTLKPKDLKDDAGALYYVVAVVLIFGFSIILLIFSHVKNNRTDRYLMLHIKEMEKLRQQSKAFNTWPSNSYKRSEARLSKNRMPYNDSDADFRVYPLDIVEEYSIDNSDEANKLTPLSSNSSHLDTVFEFPKYMSLRETKHLTETEGYTKPSESVDEPTASHVNTDCYNTVCKNAGYKLDKSKETCAPSDKNMEHFEQTHYEKRDIYPAPHIVSRSQHIPAHAMSVPVSKQREAERRLALNVSRLSMYSRPVCHSVTDDDGTDIEI